MDLQMAWLGLFNSIVHSFDMTIIFKQTILQEKFYFLMQSLVDRQVFEQEEV